jgi:hypothetical protein
MQFLHIVFKNGREGCFELLLRIDYIQSTDLFFQLFKPLLINVLCGCQNLFPFAATHAAKGPANAQLGINEDLRENIFYMIKVFEQLSGPSH